VSADARAVDAQLPARRVEAAYRVDEEIESLVWQPVPMNSRRTGASVAGRARRRPGAAMPTDVRDRTSEGSASTSAAPARARVRPARRRRPAPRHEVEAVARVVRRGDVGEARDAALTLFGPGSAAVTVEQEEAVAQVERVVQRQHHRHPPRARPRSVGESRPVPRVHDVRPVLAQEARKATSSTWLSGTRGSSRARRGCSPRDTDAIDHLVA
jgi:hypothetical protein